jgi:NAD(P) transhydrogenase subunit alpha
MWRVLRQRFLILASALACCTLIAVAQSTTSPPDHPAAEAQTDYWTLFFVLVLATFIGVGVIARVSRLLHTPLMSITNAISAIAVVGSIIVTGSDYPTDIRILGAIALFASMTNIVSGFLITDRMLKMFKPPRRDAGGQERKGVKP